jgi:Zn ribbon nucleic-acid-binding protein
MFVVKCPQCKHDMRYHALKTGLVTEKRKRCVYCGHAFKIHVNLKDSRIVREEEKHTTTPLFHNAEQVKEFSKKSGAE